MVPGVWSAVQQIGSEGAGGPDYPAGVSVGPTRKVARPLCQASAARVDRRGALADEEVSRSRRRQDRAL